MTKQQLIERIHPMRQMTAQQKRHLPIRPGRGGKATRHVSFLPWNNARYGPPPVRIEWDGTPDDWRFRRCLAGR